MFLSLDSTYSQIILLFRIYIPRVDGVGFELPLFPPTCPWALRMRALNDFVASQLRCWGYSPCWHFILADSNMQNVLMHRETTNWHLREILLLDWQATFQKRNVSSPVLFFLYDLKQQNMHVLEQGTYLLDVEKVNCHLAWKHLPNISSR